MQLDTIALIISVASFIGVILGPVTTNLITARQAAMERKETHRKDRQNYLTNVMQSLIRLRAELQYLQGGDITREKDREQAYGEAYAIMLSISDDQIRDSAEQIMTGTWNNGQNE